MHSANHPKALKEIARHGQWQGMGNGAKKLERKVQRPGTVATEPIILWPLPRDGIIPTGFRRDVLQV